MATRQAIILNSGFFEELNTSSDKLDLAGNDTDDLSEGSSNQYFTNARARSAISVTDSGGDGSLAYNSGTGVITYTGPSASEVRAHLSVATGSGLTYNATSGEFGTSAIPNSQLANSSLTVGSTSISLGGTATTVAGLTSLTSTTLEGSTTVRVGAADAANGILLNSSGITFEGSSADANETVLTVANPTADRTLTLPDNTGTLLSTGSSIANANLANSSVTVGSTSIALGATATTIAGLTSLTSTTLEGTTTVRVGAADAANGLLLNSSGITFEGSTANAHETTLSVTDPTADRSIVFPDAAGTVVLLGSLSVASGSGLTYNSGTGEFGTSAIPNGQLANSSVTVGSTAIALGGSATTITGLTSVTTTGLIVDDQTSGLAIRDADDATKIARFDSGTISTGTTRTFTFPDENGTLLTSASSIPGGNFIDNTFRISDNGDNSKKLAFECSGITASTTRTMTIPDSNGTISTESFATAIAVALG
tara:strand:- start:686 stop:2134 length:1449 start_codon:yes stop_codon:yes gene_type:complete